MYIPRALQDKFYFSVNSLQYAYVVYFLTIGTDYLFAFSGIEWDKLLSPLLLQMMYNLANIQAAMVLMIAGGIQICIGLLLALPYTTRIGAYFSALFLFLTASDLLLSGFFFHRGILYFMLTISALVLINLLDVREGLTEGKA